MEDKLIVSVCTFPELYDTTSYFYRDKNKKDTAWQKVSEEVQLPVEVCRRKWKSLRDTYLREKKKEGERKSGSAAGQGKRWKYSAVLSFLDPFITPRETSSNMARGVEEDGAAEESMIDEGHDRDEAAAAGPSSVEIEHQDQSSDDESAPPATPATPASPADGPSAAAGGPAAGSSQGRSNIACRSRKRGRERDDDRRMRIEELLIHSLEREKAPPPPPPPACEDAQFLNSLLPSLKRLPTPQKEFVKFQIHKLIYEAGTFTLNLESVAD